METETLMKEREHLEAVIQQATTLLKNAPKGSLGIRKRGEYSYFYLLPENKYLSLKINKSLIESLVQKAYAKKILKAAIEQKTAIEKFLAVYNPNIFDEVVENWNPQKLAMITKHF